MNEYSIVVGAVYHSGTLTVAMRRGTKFGPVIQRPDIGDGGALAYIFDAANRHRHSSPIFHVAGDDVPRIIETLRKASVNVNAFNWHAAVNGGGFANLGSMAFAELREQINAQLRSGVADEALSAELEAFEEVGSGVVEYLSPGKVADRLGRYPARALAILLANQYSGASATEYRPLAGGHVPVQHSVGGHDPFSTFN